MMGFAGVAGIAQSQLSMTMYRAWILLRTRAVSSVG